MTKIICFTLLLFNALLSFSQRELPEFGKTALGDFSTKAPSFDPGAGAVKLFDVTDVAFV